ncbi:MAG TPA: MFS transporter [Chloroflexi bacterium]|nr:MAG: MFS transporter [Chloroflexota bacterium]HDD56258.1 MFS transporter [Chloroflexota bacterium]
MTRILRSLSLTGSLRALNHRNFRLFFWGQLISVIGVWMQSTAQQWLVYRITGSQTSLGLVTFISFLPVLLLSLFMGVIVDQLPRRKLIIFTQSWFMIGAFVLAALTWLDLVQYWHILVLSFTLGIGSALDMPARQAFVSEMVDDDKNDLLNALSLNSSIFNVARIIGPAIGGAIVAALGEAPTFAINGLSYLAVIAALVLMRLKPLDYSVSRESNLNQMREGFQYLASEKDIMGLVTMVAVYSFVGFGSLTLVPVFAKDILKIGVEGFGHMLSWQGVGALLGGALLIFFGDHFHKGKLLLFSRVLIGPGIAGLALSRTPWISMALMTVMGFSLITQLVISNTMIQTIVPDNLRGRVISTYTWALGGFYPLGSLLMGALGDQIGAPTAALISGLGCLLLLLFRLAVFPNLHKLN